MNDRAIQDSTGATQMTNTIQNSESSSVDEVPKARRVVVTSGLPSEG